MKKTCLGFIVLLFVSLLNACESYSDVDFTESTYTIENDVSVSHYRIGVYLEKETGPFTKRFDAFEAFSTYKNGLLETAGEAFEDSPFMVHLSQFDEVYFEDNTLILLYIIENSGSNQHRVRGLGKDNGTLIVNTLRKEPSMGTTDMAYWMITLCGTKETLEGDDVTINFETYTPKR